MTVGEALLSPTRTYAPLIRAVLENSERTASGIIHCSGGGQTKIGKFGGTAADPSRNGLCVKDSLLPMHRCLRCC